jgi:hypothetical protein
MCPDQSFCPVAGDVWTSRAVGRIAPPGLRAVNDEWARTVQTRSAVQEGDDRRPVAAAEKRIDARKAFGLEFGQELHKRGAPKMWRDAIAQFVVANEKRQGRRRV